MITVPKPTTGETMVARKIMVVAVPGNAGGDFDWAAYMLDLSAPHFNAEIVAGIGGAPDDAELVVLASRHGDKLPEDVARFLLRGPQMPTGRYRS